MCVCMSVSLIFANVTHNNDFSSLKYKNSRWFINWFLIGEQTEDNLSNFSVVFKYALWYFEYVNYQLLLKEN